MKEKKKRKGMKRESITHIKCYTRYPSIRRLWTMISYELIVFFSNRKCVWDGRNVSRR